MLSKRCHRRRVLYEQPRCGPWSSAPDFQRNVFYGREAVVELDEEVGLKVELEQGLVHRRRREEARHDNVDGDIDIVQDMPARHLHTLHL